MIHTCRAIFAVPSQSAVSPTRRLYAAATAWLALSLPPPSVGAAEVSSADLRPGHAESSLDIDTAMHSVCSSDCIHIKLY